MFVGKPQITTWTPSLILGIPALKQNKSKIYSTHILPVTFGEFLIPKLRGKNSTNSQISPETLDKK